VEDLGLSHLALLRPKAISNPQAFSISIRKLRLSLTSEGLFQAPTENLHSFNSHSRSTNQVLGTRLALSQGLRTWQLPMTKALYLTLDCKGE
jgi:hypothetical protein